MNNDPHSTPVSNKVDTVDSMLQFADHDQLLTRVSEEIRLGRPLTFLCGSAISAAPQADQVGVPTAREMADSVVERFGATGDLRARLARLPFPQSAAARYQTAMQFVVGSYGQDVLNQIVREAVLRARTVPTEAPNRLEELDRSTEGWGLPPAVEALGHIVAQHLPSFNVPLLTTNFDPLMEVSIRRAGRPAITVYMTSDGRFDNMITHDAAKIVHMHGYWIGSDTFHTPQQIEQQRPQLRNCLRQLLSRTTLVVLGYGGWTDVFTRTLVEIVSDGSTEYNVLWTFLSNDPVEIQSKHGDLLHAVKASSGTRLALYQGIDCHEFLPRLKAAVAWPSFRGPVGEQRPNIDRERPIQDFPPSTAAWVGREAELERLAQGDSKVIAITGIGGQGKSALAAKFLERSVLGGKVEFWDWRDCKEQSHTLNTQLAFIIQRLTNNSPITPSLQGEQTSYLIDTLFAVLGNRRTVLVFDNTDQYVDVERGRFVAGLDLLVARALKTGHRTTFVFTCRPRVEFLGDGHLRIDLSGLTRADASRLFKLRGVRDVGDEPVRTRVERVQELTDGHPLWMNLIATQVSQQPDRFELFLDRLARDRNAALPRNLLLEVWEELNARQQRVLRYMAEMVTAENENDIAEFSSADLNFNQVHRALRTLKGLDLIVTKSSGTDETLELHPLVRQFIRQEFPMNERVQYINPILRFLEKVLGRFAPPKGTKASASHTRYAAARVELCMNAGQHEAGALSLLEIENSLVEHGHSEEFVRLAAPLLDSAKITDNALYDKLVAAAVRILSELGHFADADHFLESFETVIPGKTARYIRLCDLRAYSLWCRRDYALAIEWARRGDELKASGGLDTANDCLHTLALARRDSGDIAGALEYFRQNVPLQDLLVGKVPEQFMQNGPFWGNVGRCFQLRGELSAAAYCLSRSAICLSDDDGRSGAVNRGWAAKWLGEIAEAEGDSQGAYVCFLSAREYWRRSSPPRSSELAADIARLGEHGTEIPLWRLERSYHEWLDARITP